jgi:hypothetical protein
MDLAAQEALAWGGVTDESLTELGRLVGDPRVQRWAVEANAYPRVLRFHHPQAVPAICRP